VPGRLPFPSPKISLRAAAGRREQKRASVAGRLFSFEKREGEPETDDETGEEKKFLYGSKAN